MHITSSGKKPKRSFKKVLSEDYRYLQKKISGRSVYRSIVSAYKRTPKHRRKILDPHYQ